MKNKLDKITCVGNISLQDFLDVAREIRAYQVTAENPKGENRGDGRISPKTFKAVYKNYNSGGLGVCTVFKHSDDDYEFLDFHSRSAGLVARYKENLFSEYELKNHFVTVRVYTQAELNRLGETKESIYAVLNSTDGHTTKLKLTGTNYAFGRLLTTILQRSGISEKNTTLWSKARPQLAYILYTLAHNGDMDFINCTRNKNAIKSLINITDDIPILPLRPGDIDLVISGIAYYEKVLEAVQALYPPMTKRELSQNEALKGLKTGSSLFAYILIDFLGARSFTFMKPETLAKKIFSDIAKIVILGKYLTAGSTSDMEDVALKLKATIKRLKSVA